MKTRFMKSLARRIAPPAHILALLALVAMGSAWAAVTADAVWEGGFVDGSSKTGASGITYTLNLKGNTTDATGDTLPITKNLGAQISLGSSSSANLAVLVKYSALSAAPADTYELAAIRVKGKGWPGLRVATANGYELTGFYEDTSAKTYNFSTNPKLSSTGGYFLLCHQGALKTGGYAGPVLYQLSGGETTSLKWGGGTTLDTIVLGGPSETGRATPAYTGLVIEKVAIFNQAVTGANLAQYAFPSEDPATTYDYTATITENTAFSDITTWTKGTGTPGTDAKVYIKSENNAVLTIDGNLDVGTLWVDGGSIAIADGVTIGSTKIIGAPINISATTANFTGSVVASKITCENTSTVNFTDCEITGGVFAGQNQNTTINTSGTVAFGSVFNNEFQYSTKFNINSGTTTYNSNGGKLLWCNVTVKSGATLVNEKEDAFNYSANSGWPIHAYVYGTLTMNKKWTIGGGGNYIHLYNGAMIDGSANNALHFNTGVGRIVAEAGTSTITASVVKGEGTIEVTTKENTILVLSSAPAMAKSGSGTLRIKNADLTSDISGSEGVLELYNDSGANKTHYNTISFSGTIRVVRENSNKSHNVFGSSNEITQTTGQDIVLTGMPKLEIGGAYAYICLNAQLANQNLSVKNLTYEGSASDAKVDPVFNDGTSSGNMAQIKTIKTKQTEDTICNLIFNGEANSGKRQSALYVYGDTDNTHSLTLTKASTTFGPLTVENFGKVIFSGSGKWQNGTITVGENGVLESQCAASIGAALKVKEGATLKFADGVQLQADSYDWSEISTDESINVDLSAIPPSTSPITLIPSRVTIGAAKFKVSSAQTTVALSVDGGALVATFGAFWRDGSWSGSIADGDDAELFLSQDSEFTVSDVVNLGEVTIVKETENDVVLTVSGEGTLATKGWTIPAGVTVKAADGMTISGTVSMEGTSAYETSAMIVVPDGVVLTLQNASVSGTAYTRIIVQSGGTLVLDGTTCNAKINAENGSEVKTKGACLLNATAWHLFDQGSKLTVETGVATVRTEGQGFKGDIEILSGAELVEANSNDDGLSYTSSCTIDIRGKLTMGSRRWTIGASNVINLYEGAEVSGTNESNGVLDWKDSNSVLNVKGNATIDANLRFRNSGSSCNVTVNIDEGKTLTVKKAFATSYATGILTKAGAGTLKLDKVGLTTPVLQGSEGTVLLYNDATSHSTHSAASVAFTGKIDFTSEGRNGHLIDNDFSFAANSRPQLAINTKQVNVDYNNAYGYLFFSTGWNNKTFAVRDLIGEGRVCMKASGSVAQATTIETKQTQDTEFSGIFICNDAVNDAVHLANLSVIGDGSGILHSLTLSGANTSIGQLSVNDNSKVIFADNGSVNGAWASGTVSVGATGYLQSDSSAASVAATLTLADGATLVCGSQPVKATALTALDADATIKIAFADGVAPVDGMVVLSGTWATTPDAARFAFANAFAYASLYEFIVTDSAVTIKEKTETVSVSNTSITVGYSWIAAAQQQSYASGVPSLEFELPGYLTATGRNGMPRAVSYLLGLTNPDDASTAFVATALNVSSGVGGTTVFAITGKTYSTDRAMVTYSLLGGDSPDNLSSVVPDSVDGNVVTVTLPAEAVQKYYRLVMDVTPN